MKKEGNNINEESHIEENKEYFLKFGIFLNLLDKYRRNRCLNLSGLVIFKTKNLLKN